MLKVNLINFHCLILYKDMINSEYYDYIIDGSLHWINHSLNDAMYLAAWKRGMS
jgi:hypothetical protein